MIAWSWECTPVIALAVGLPIPELSGMSRLRSGQSTLHAATLDAWVRPFRRTTLQASTANTRIGGSPFAWDGFFDDKNQ